MLSSLLTGEWEDMGQLGGELGLQGRELGLQGRELGLQRRELGLQGRREDWQGTGDRREEWAEEEGGNDDDTDIDNENKDFARTGKLSENIEIHIPEKPETNLEIYKFDIDIKNPLEAQSPKFHIEKLPAQVEATPRDLKLELDVKLKAQKLQFQLENSGLTLSEQNRKRCLAAAEAVLTGQVATVRMAAEYFNVNQHTLTQGIKRGHFKKKPGGVKKAFTNEEEKKLVRYIRSLDFEITMKQIGTAVQEALLDVTKNNPERKTGMEDTGQMPGYSWVRRFVARNRLNPLKPSPHGLPWQKLDLEKFAKWQRINYGT